MTSPESSNAAVSSSPVIEYVASHNQHHQIVDDHGHLQQHHLQPVHHQFGHFHDGNLSPTMLAMPHAVQDHIALAYVNAANSGEK